MKLEITAEWLKSMDDDIREPGLPTVEDFIELARRKDARLCNRSSEKTTMHLETRSPEELVAAR